MHCSIEAAAFGQTVSEVISPMLKSFLFGATVYPALELLYRQRTHYAMSLAGGCSFVLIKGISGIKVPLLGKAALSACAITGIEYLFGLLWNRHFTIWDYRSQPLNFQGQICLKFTMIWFLLSLIALKGFDLAHRITKKAGQ